MECWFTPTRASLSSVLMMIVKHPLKPNSAVLAPQSGQPARLCKVNRFEDRFGAFLAYIPLLAAIPLASNRPIWWVIWGAVIGLAAAYYFIRTGRTDSERPTGLRGCGAFMLLALLVPGFAAIQASPIAGHLPSVLTALPAHLTEELRPASLSLAPSASVLGAMRAVALILFFVLVVEVSRRSARRNRISRILFLGVTAHAAWGLVALNLLGDANWWGVKDSHLGYATGTFVNRNSFATFLGFGLILGVAMQLQPSEKGRPPERTIAQALECWAYWGCIVVIAFAVLATQSRLGLAATMAGVAVTAVLMRSRGQRRWLRGVLEVGTAAVLVIAGGIILGGDTLVERLVLVQSEYEARLQIHRQVLTMIELRPWTGYGYDAFGPAFVLFRQMPLLADAEIDLAHNSYLTLWAEIGLVAGSLPILLLGGVGIRIAISLRRRSSISAPSAALGALVLTGIHSTGDFSLEIMANNLMLAAIIGTGFSHMLTAIKPQHENR
jgi:O-antigen ligase